MATQQARGTDVQKCSLSDRTSFRAFYGSDYLLIIAVLDTGPAWTLHLTRRLPDGDVPEFVFERCRKPGLQPLFIVKDARFAEIVPQAPRPEHIKIHYSGGTDDVKVEDLSPELSAYKASLPRDQGLVSGVEATGYSPNLSFDEALANANANMPPASPNPD